MATDLIGKEVDELRTQLVRMRRTAARAKNMELYNQADNAQLQLDRVLMAMFLTERHHDG